MRELKINKIIPQSKQIEALETYEFETLYGGARGGGKTFAGILWLIKPDLIQNPKYRALVIRKNSDDLKDWIDRAREIYSSVNLGCNFAGNPPEIRFPSGALIRLGHLKDDNAYTKYQGHEYQRILIEELTQIPEEKNYIQLISSCRTTVKGIDARVFATANPGGAGHCIPYGDVLTPEGWKQIEMIKIGDYVCSDDDGKITFLRVDQKIEEDYCGNLYVSSNWSARFIATPNHSLPIITETKNKKGRTFHSLSLRKIKDFKKVTRLPKIGEWKGFPIHYFGIENTEKRRKKKRQPLIIDGNNYCELMGWFLSEGYANKRLGIFGISQTKEKNKSIISNLLERIGFSFKWNGHTAVIYSRSWSNYFSIFGKCREKFIPRILKEATRKQLRIFYKAMLLGDGHKNHYYTISKKLADDMCDIGLKLGKRIYISSRERKNRKGLSYDISFKPNKIGWIEKDKITEIKYSGKVFCLGIDNVHNFYLRQNGTVFLSGNSWVKNRFIDVAPYNTTYTDTITGRKRIYIPATIDDNPILKDSDPNYVHFLDGLKQVDENLWKAWRLGSWDIFAGMYFREFRRDLHSCRPFVPNSKWVKFGSIDWGYSPRPFVFLAHVIKPEKTENGVSFNRIITYKEISGTDKIPEDWAKEIKNSCDLSEFSYIRVDPSMCHKKPDGSISIADQMKNELGQYAYLVKPANNDRVGGWTILHKWLSIAPDGLPYWLITENCQNLLTTIPQLQHDDNNPRDLDTTGPDDYCDSARYGLVHYKWIDAKVGQVGFTKNDKIISKYADNLPLDLSAFETARKDGGYFK